MAAWMAVMAAAAVASAATVASSSLLSSQVAAVGSYAQADSTDADTGDDGLGMATAADSAVDNDMYVPIVAVARTYGDSITLRWAVNSYPEWLYLTRHGVDILRHDDSDPQFTLDTLARALRPLSLDAFRSHYPDERDSMAYLAMGSLYGQGSLRPEDSRYYSKSVQALVEVAEDQKMYLIAAFMAAERRPDLAEALALRFTDRNVKSGATYSYYIVPTEPDTTGHLFISNAIIDHLRNEPYKPGPYEAVLADSVSGHCQSVLSWNDPVNGLFDIFRRPAGVGEWTKVNGAPYVPPFDFSLDSQDILFADSVPAPGVYEYSVQAYDAFGDRTSRSQTHRVTYPDLLPPAGASISRIVIDRPDGDDPTSKIYADIYFRKDSLERDFTHYVPLYANTRDSLRQWRLLSDQYVAPTDTMVRVDVTHVSTGMITIAAVDTAGNMGYAMPRLLRVADLKPPSAPTGLKADAQLDGTILLTWEMADTLDLRYYDVFFANAPDHEFTKLNALHVYGRSYMDTVAVDANERYIYYCVRGVDWAMNQGLMSDTLRVLRPNVATPAMAHLDTMWVDDKMIHTRWVGVGDEIAGRYEVYRRKEGDKEWSLLRSLDADSVRSLGYVFQIDDAPEPDLRRGYEYAVQTVSLWGLTSGLTPVLTARLTGRRTVDFPLTLEGTYDAMKRSTRIAWTPGETPQDAPFFYCVWRKGPRDDGFGYVTDAPASERMYTDYLLEPGESAQYRVSVRFRDGRKGPTSNIVTVTAPKRDDAK